MMNIEEHEKNVSIGYDADGFPVQASMTEEEEYIYRYGDGSVSWDEDN